MIRLSPHSTQHMVPFLREEQSVMDLHWLINTC